MKYIVVTIIAICSITGLASLAVCNGIDGAFLMSSIAVIGGLGGHALGKRKGKPVLKDTTLPQPKQGDTE